MIDVVIPYCTLDKLFIENIIEQCLKFSRPFLGKDCVHGYEFEKVEPSFGFNLLKQ